MDEYMAQKGPKTVAGKAAPSGSVAKPPKTK
jgi:hypothetical protein